MSINRDDQSATVDPHPGRKAWETPRLEILPVPDRTESGAFICKPVEQPALYKPS